MKHRLLSQDITDYALNELEPRERLYVESVMLGSEELREDATAMIEMARLLEEGFALELDEVSVGLGGERREKILEQANGFSVWRVVGKVAVGLASLAACLTFSALAPMAWNLAMRPGMSNYASRGLMTSESSGPAGLLGESSSDSGRLVPEIPTAVLIGSYPIGEEFTPVVPVEDSTGSATLPNVTVGYVDMPFSVGVPAATVEFN
jgi:hypothetical protein